MAVSFRKELLIDGICARGHVSVVTKDGSVATEWSRVKRENDSEE
jgi:hypothetical protein